MKLKEIVNGAATYLVMNTKQINSFFEKSSNLYENLMYLECSIGALCALGGTLYCFHNPLLGSKIGAASMMPVLDSICRISQSNKKTDSNVWKPGIIGSLGDYLSKYKPQLK